jgi:L-cystine uptake protein TcyP (sodium:dicarboxylate symporter family)
MKLRLPNVLTTTESEYAAHQAGMNMFFGAVLGFVMAGTERLDQLEFAFTLMFVSAIVISILYVAASPYKWAYAVLTVVMIASLPWAFGTILEQGEKVPDKLQATLYVWTFITIFVEFLPRRPDAASDDS